VVREDADSLVVTANSETGGIVEIWELREKVMTVHKVLQKSSTPPPEFKTVVCFLVVFPKKLCLRKKNPGVAAPIALASVLNDQGHVHNKSIPVHGRSCLNIHNDRAERLKTALSLQRFVETGVPKIYLV
jgi:hypothetical protein